MTPNLYRATFTVRLPDATERDCVIDPLAARTEDDALVLLRKLIALSVGGTIASDVRLEPLNIVGRIEKLTRDEILAELERKMQEITRRSIAELQAKFAAAEARINAELSASVADMRHPWEKPKATNNTIQP